MFSGVEDTVTAKGKKMETSLTQEKQALKSAQALLNSAKDIRVNLEETFNSLKHISEDYSARGTILTIFTLGVWDAVKWKQQKREVVAICDKYGASPKLRQKLYKDYGIKQ